MNTVFDRAAFERQLSTGARTLDVQLSDRQIDLLIDYLALLAKWNAVYNLTAVRDPEQMVTHHVLDSLAIAPMFADANHVLDVGAGGGLPGLVLAIWALEQRPEMRVAMVDTVSKKTAFLTQAKAELGLSNVTVHTARVEDLQVAEKFDVITSRAFAELKDFVDWSGHLLNERGRFMAMKGVMPEEEIRRLPDAWQVSDIKPLQVPGLNAERHLIVIERKKQI